MNYNFTIKEIKNPNNEKWMEAAKEESEIIKKHLKEIDEDNFDPIFEESFVKGGKQYVEFLLDIINKNEIQIKNPLYQIIDGKLYKRMEK